MKISKMKEGRLDGGWNRDKTVKLGSLGNDTPIKQQKSTKVSGFLFVYECIIADCKGFC